MGAADEAALPYGITQDSIVIVPLVVIGLYATLSLLRTIFDYAKSGTKEKGKTINSNSNDKQNIKTPAELFRQDTRAVQYAEEISRPLHLPARGKDIPLGSATELSNILDRDATGDKSIYPGGVHTVSEGRKDTDVSQASLDRANDQRGQIRRSDNCSHEIRQADRLLNTDCTFDPQTVKHILVGITKTVIQETQKQMYNAIEQSLQQTYATLSLETPVKAEEQSMQYINNENIVVLTSNTGNPPLTENDWQEIDDAWNLDGVQPSLPSSAIQPATTSSDTTTPKVVASSTSADHISGAAAANTNTGRATVSSRPSAYISGIPAGYETDDDYIAYYRPDNPRLIATSSSFAAHINFRGSPNNRQVRGHRPYQQPQTFSRPPPWHNRPYGRKTRSQEALRARAYRKVARRYPLP